eukprot:scaffold7289_cov123-Isochrysis_galbana.AAC.1
MRHVAESPLVGKRFAVDRHATCAVARGEVSSLTHESRVVQRHTRGAHALLARAKGAEVLHSLRAHTREELELNAPSKLPTNLDVHEHLGIARGAAGLVHRDTRAASPPAGSEWVPVGHRVDTETEEAKAEHYQRQAHPDARRRGRAGEFEQLELENQHRVARDVGWDTPTTVAQVGRDGQLPFVAGPHHRQSFRPAGDNLIWSKCGRLAAPVAAIELRAVHKPALVMAHTG